MATLLVTAFFPNGLVRLIKPKHNVPHTDPHDS